MMRRTTIFLGIFLSIRQGVCENEDIVNSIDREFVNPNDHITSGKLKEYENAVNLYSVDEFMDAEKLPAVIQAACFVMQFTPIRDFPLSR